MWEENGGASYNPNVAHLARCGVEGGWQWSGFFFSYFPPLKPRYVLQSGASYSPKNTVNVGPFGLRLCVIFFLIFFHFFVLLFCILRGFSHLFLPTNLLHSECLHSYLYHKLFLALVANTLQSSMDRSPYLFVAFS